MLRRRFVPLLLALALVAELGVALVGVSDLRADQRRADAAAAERRAVAAYRKQVLPITASVYDAVQPLQDVDDAFADPQAGLFEARHDVLLHSGAANTLTALGRQVSALRVPKSVSGPARQLTAAADLLRAAAVQLARAEASRPDSQGFQLALPPAYLSLATAEGAWYDALIAVYGGTYTGPYPFADRLGERGRRTATHGGFLAAAARTCTQAFLDVNSFPKRAASDAILIDFPKIAAIGRRANRALAALPLPPKDAVALARLRRQLVAAERLPRAFEELSAAFRARDAQRFDAGRLSFVKALVISRDVSRSLAAYGSDICARVYDTSSDLSSLTDGTLRT